MKTKFLRTLSQEPLNYLDALLEEYDIHLCSTPHDREQPAANISVVSTYYLDDIQDILEATANAFDLDYMVTNGMRARPDSNQSALIYAPRVYKSSLAQAQDEFHLAEKIMQYDKETIWYMDSDSFLKYRHLLPE